MMQNARMEKYPLKFRIMVVSGSIALMIFAASAGAQTAATGTPQAYPVKALRFILPFPPGGATDAVGRTVIDRLQSALKQNVVADYRPGAGGNLGYGLVAKAPSDGYTLGQCSPSIAISPALYKNPGYDLHDIAPVSLVANIPSLLVVHPSVPANNIKELIALARRNPGKLNFGSGGVGTSNHLAGEMFKSLAKINIVHVPYKGTSVAMFALITGETDLVTIGPRRGAAAAARQASQSAGGVAQQTHRAVARGAHIGGIRSARLGNQYLVWCYRAGRNAARCRHPA